MTFDWAEYLGLARDLAGPHADAPATGSPASRFRASISRAYYAAFGRAFAFAAHYDEELATTRQEKHAKLIKWFEDQRDTKRDYWTIAQKLRALRDDRHRADYEPTAIPNIETKVKQTLLQAAFVIQTVAGLPPPRLRR